MDSQQPSPFAYIDLEPLDFEFLLDGQLLEKVENELIFNFTFIF